MKALLHKINSINRLYKHSFELLNEFEQLKDDTKNCSETDLLFFEIIAPLIAIPKIHFMKTTIQHSDITTFDHVLSVSYLSFLLSKRLGWNYRSVARAALLHDLVYYDWHEIGDGSHKLHGYRHPGFAANNAKEITELSKLEENIIRRHMWPLTPTPPRYKESFLVCMVDKYCATRETFKKYL